MGLIIEAVYAKKLGLPGFSSHQYSVSIRAELSDLSQVEQESSRLYGLLQDSVDQSIQHIGFLPDGSNNSGAAQHGTNGHKVNGHHHVNGNGAWRCSDKQRDLIEKVVREKNLDKAEVEQVAIDMFGCGVRALNRLQASGLIDEIFERYGGTPAPNGSRQRSNGGHRQNIAAIASQTRAVSKPYTGGASA